MIKRLPTPFFSLTQDILDDLDTSTSNGDSKAATLKSLEPKALIFGCPASDEADEQALQMLRRLLDPTRCQLEIISAHTLASEVLSQVERENPSVVCISLLPPGGFAQARYLCKRLREAARRREELQAAGADLVTTSLEETRVQIAPLGSILAHVPDARVLIG